MTDISTSDAVQGIRLKLARAQEHLSSLSAQIKHFYTTVDFGGTPIANPETKTLVYHLKVSEPFPIMWGVLLGEVVHNVRSALDHAVYQLTIDNKGKVLEETGFPIFTKEAAFYEKGESRIRGVGPGVRDYILQCQPFRHAEPLSHPLAALQALWNQDKHRLIQSWGALLDPVDSKVEITGDVGKSEVIVHQEVLQDGDAAITVRLEKLNPAAHLNAHFVVMAAFVYPRDPGGSHFPLTALIDLPTGIVSTLLSAFGRQDGPIP